MSSYDEIAEELAGLTDAAEIANTLRGYANRDVTAVVAANVAAGGGSLPAGGSTGEVLTKESDADGDAGWEPSGGSQPYKLVRIPIAWDTPGQLATLLPLTGVDQGTQTFTVAGNHVALFPVGQRFTVDSSTGNDGTYTVASATLNAGSTDVVVVEAIPDPTVDGSLWGGLGIVLYTPAAAGEYLVSITDSIPTTPWDGAQPTMNLVIQGADYAHESLTSISLDDQDNSNDPQPGLRIPTDLNRSPAEYFLMSTAPIMVVVSDGSGGDPGASQGEGEIILELWAAP